jgi:hypothetical protein
MKRYLIVATMLFTTIVTTSWADIQLQLYPDSAPNGNVAGWKAQVFPQVVAGTFENMENGTRPGTTTFNPSDAIVYSVPNYGNRLMWTYWIPNMTVNQLAGMNFQVKTAFDWDGVAYTTDWNTGAPLADGANVGWGTPASWINYNGGVIGAFGNSWWAVHGTDPNSPDYYTGVTQGDINGLAGDMLAYQTYWTGEVQYQDADGTHTMDLQLNLVPEPTTMMAGALLLLPFGASTLRILRKARTA